MRWTSSLKNTGALLALGIGGAVVSARQGAIKPAPTAQIPPVVRALAERSLAEMRSAPPELAATFGLANAEEAKQARLGTPVREFVVPLDALRRYQAKTPVAKLLTDGTTYLFPVLVGATLRSSVRVSAAPGGAPKVLGLGGVEVFTQLDRLPEVAARLRTAGSGSLMAIRVPALGLYFAGRRRGATLETASLFDVPNERLKSGVWEDAETLFARLVPFARALRESAM